jgi:hypothetical protein
MNTDFDELVRDSMTWFTDGIDAPAGLAEQARRHCRRRRNARLGWLAAGTALASAAAAAVISGPVTTGPGPLAHSRTGAAAHAQTTAVVISRVDRALTHAGSGDPIAYTRETGSGVTIDLLIPHGKPGFAQASVTTRWARGGLQHSEFSTRSGQVVESIVGVTRSGKDVETSVAYPQRVWWRSTYRAQSSPRPAVSCALGPVQRSPAQWASEVRKLLSCGAADVGSGKTGGPAAIEFKLSSHQRACAASSSGPCREQDVSWHGFLWVSASTYLPTRLVMIGHHYEVGVDFGWLPPTSANLSLLHQRIPAGFRHV